MKNIVFDLGGVIADLDIRGMLERFVALGWKPQAGVAAFPREGDEMRMIRNLADLGPIAELISKMDRGDISGLDFARLILRDCAPDTTLEQVVDTYNSLIVIPRERIEWIASLRQQYRILLLSNIGDLHWAYFQKECARQGVPVSEMFDDIYVSYQLHMAKPEPAIFEHLIEDSGITPAETLYIDDSPANIQMGASYGLQTCLIEPNSGIVGLVE